jgi:hypothetical protein
VKADDAEPLQIVARIAPGRSARGWNYGPQAISQLVDQIQAKTLNGYLGHQRGAADDGGRPLALPPMSRAWLYCGLKCKHRAYRARHGAVRPRGQGLCLECRHRLPEGSHPTRRYCRVSCRSRMHRRRTKLRLVRSITGAIAA